MDTARISTLLKPFIERSLNQSQLEQISTYIDLLIRWNTRINLTAIRKEEEIVTRHFGESFFMATHLFSKVDCHPERSQVLDIGSGAGFPALPLKIWAPEIRLTLIESNHKKAAFLQEVARTLTLTNINVITERAESVAGSPADVVTLRAVERFETILPQALAFLAPAGRLALLIGETQLPTLKALTHLHWTSPIRVPESHSRVLSIGIRDKRWE
jgi:16S rRNA (guanine527-N7)-methyltransferase